MERAGVPLFRISGKYPTFNTRLKLGYGFLQLGTYLFSISLQILSSPQALILSFSSVIVMCISHAFLKGPVSEQRAEPCVANFETKRYKNKR